jgi:hypothetical protein
MVRAGIVLALVGVLIAVAASLLYVHVLMIPQVSPQQIRSITWVSWAMGGVFVISGAAAAISIRKRRGGPT